jgi:LPXTG-motif cell wall-anchored protein
VDVAPPGQAVYTPVTAFRGTDSFTYVVTDDAGGTDTATVTVHVGIHAGDDAATAPSGELVGGDLHANDVGVGFLVTSLETPPAHGTAEVLPEQLFRYRSAESFSGTDSFTYRVTDSVTGETDVATVTVTVTPVAEPDAVRGVPGVPVRVPVLDNDRGAGLSVTAAALVVGGLGALVVRDGLPEYTPGDVVGTHGFTYVLVDAAGRTASAAVTVVVTDAVGRDDEVTAADRGPVTVRPLDNDVPSELAAWDVGTLRLLDPVTGVATTSVVDAGRGVWDVLPDGTLRLTPEPGVSGRVVVRYTAVDTAGADVVATVGVTYPAPAATAPTAGRPTAGTTAATRLPATGSGTAPTLLLAGALLAAGATLVAVDGRRRRRASDVP